MLLEGEVNWALVFGILAAVMSVIALMAVVFASTHRTRHVSTSDELDLVQKVAESADKRLFQTLNAVPVALVETDRQGKFVFANRAAHQLLGRRDAELVGLRFHSATWGITFPDGRPIPPDLLPSARALRGQTVKGFHHVIANPATRRKMTVSVTAMPIEDEYGTVIGSTSVLVETDGLTTPEPVVFEAPAPVPGADLTRRVFEAATSALVVVSAHGVVREANRAALDGLGRSEGVVGADFADLFLAEGGRTEGRQALRAALIAAPGEAEPLVAQTPDGETLAWRILPLADGEGRIDALLLAGDLIDLAPEGGIDAMPEPTTEILPATPSFPVETDAGELEDLRRQLADARADAETALAEAERASHDAVQARARADRADAEARAEGDAARRLEAVDRVTGGGAQDFHALLGVMTSALDMMLKQADDPSRVRRLGEAALAAGRRGEAMMRRLSAVTPMGDAPDQSLDAGVLLQAMETRLRVLAGSGVDLMIEAPSRPAPLRVDPVAFEAAVRALVANAVEAVEGSGSVAVRLEATPDGARLSVRDSGPGMDPDTLVRAREAFFTTRADAAGLGLAQAHAFARQCGGVLSIDSTPGEGSEVSVTLPRASAAAA